MDNKIEKENVMNICIDIHKIIDPISNNNYIPIITLCGSTKFKKEFELANKLFTLANIIVFAPGVFGHSGDIEGLDEETKEKLEKLHFKKISISDSIIVINKDNYIGESTKNEIQYAKELGKLIYYLY